MIFFIDNLMPQSTKGKKKKKSKKGKKQRVAEKGTEEVKVISHIFMENLPTLRSISFKIIFLKKITPPKTLVHYSQNPLL